MPYRHAHYFVGFVLLVIMTGFWASYFNRAGAVPLAFHVHAVSSMTWLVLLIAQHLTIQRRANALHRQMGRASFALFPFLIFGFVMIINLTAANYAAGIGAVTAQLGPAFGIGSPFPHAILDTIAISDIMASLFALALWARNRKHGAPWLVAAGFMLVQAAVMWFAPFMPWLDTAFAAYASVPVPVTLMLGVAAGTAVAWLGWEAGKVQRQPTAQPA